MAAELVRVAALARAPEEEAADTAAAVSSVLVSLAEVIAPTMAAIMLVGCFQFRETRLETIMAEMVTTL